MKSLYIILTAALLLSINTAATTFEVVGACSEKPLFSKKVKLGDIDNVGDYTIMVLEKFSIPHLGTREGMNSIYNTPTGLDAMEVISDNEMNAYGWCYSINGQQPKVYPDEVNIKEGDKVLWWYGYARFLNGKWLTMCTPSFERKAQQFCN